MIDLRDDEERSLAAGEFVLGTLGAEDRAAFTAALARDRSLQALVGAWQDKLLGLSARAPAAMPPPQLWQRIEVAVAAMARTPPTVLGERPEAATAAAPGWRGLRLWQGLSGLALAASLFMAVLLVQRAPPPHEGAGARYVAVLQSPDGQAAGWVVEWRASSGLRLAPVAEGAPIPPGRALQFWTKAEGAAGPTSLGLVLAGQPLVLPLARLQGVGPRQLFEITLEPEGGSPIGRPTGPILFVGRTVAL